MRILSTTGRLLLAGSLALPLGSARADAPEAPTPGFFDRVQQRVESTWRDGQTELYVPLHTRHMRWAYTREQIDGYNETPLGLGLGRGRYDANGDWHGLYVMGFQDSHFKPEYMFGYGYKTYWPVSGALKAGLGYTAFLTTRSDIAHYTPVPGILPIASLEYERFSLDATYVPGGKGNGNILFIWSKVRF
ncbi:MAG: phospholipid:lipid A palmitoyltransferase [Candidatus Accumulibacter sp.]|nr:phospholipid:lipid A palmitoyltransferase [Accumulibacter sp.]MBA4093113.1 phospholipid:lipid A palmitoyltransferase [Accumulibacter sp.]